MGGSTFFGNVGNDVPDYTSNISRIQVTSVTTFASFHHVKVEDNHTNGDLIYSSLYIIMKYWTCMPYCVAFIRYTYSI
jgi:hypothetical protein